ncbi:MAG: HAD-IA family hydrolase [Nitrosomonadaceae bacterium]|jgi:phosphoglycolate phosphatase|nr:HAD-IA family hydrolase [Nitrosomonadaceae bacterium]MCK5715357.1 HAD-IA family hydrolase [Nitrosomonadaceae bacterium]
MSKKFDLLVFDWDGTLADSASVIVLSIQGAARDMGLTEPSNDEARHVIGLGLSEAIEYLFPDLPLQKLRLLTDRYRYHYLAHDQEISLYEGIIEIIKTLHAENFLLAVATGKSRAGLNRSFVSSGLGDYFHASRCADETFSKPHPAMLLELMSEFGVKTERTLMIGDTSHDLQMAINARVPGLGVTYGAHPREKLESLVPLACIENVMKLRSWLNTNI